MTLVGFDGIAQALFGSTRLSTIALPRRHPAARALVRIIDNAAVVSGARVLSAVLTIGETSCS